MFEPWALSGARIKTRWGRQIAIRLCKFRQNFGSAHIAGGADIRTATETDTPRHAVRIGFTAAVASG